MAKGNVVAIVIVALILVAGAGWMLALSDNTADPSAPRNVLAVAKSAARVEPELLRRRREEEQRKADEYVASISPAVDLAVTGQYDKALRQFERVESNKAVVLDRQKALCLLRLNRAREGLELMRASGGATEKDRLVVLALAVQAKDRNAMIGCLAEAELRARAPAARLSGNRDSVKSAQNERISVSDIDIPKRLMEAALEFGRRYDLDDLNLLGEEALRRGEKDAAMLNQYAAALTINGQIRKSIDIYDLAAKNATDSLQKRIAESGIYDMKNAIVLNKGGRSVAAWESDLQKRAKKYFRVFWN